jgi:hypothetical protein
MDATRPRLGAARAPFVPQSALPKCQETRRISGLQRIAGVALRAALPLATERR